MHLTGASASKKPIGTQRSGILESKLQSLRKDQPSGLQKWHRDILEELLTPKELPERKDPNFESQIGNLCAKIGRMASKNAFVFQQPTQAFPKDGCKHRDPVSRFKKGTKNVAADTVTSVKCLGGKMQINPTNFGKEQMGSESINTAAPMATI